MNGLRSLWVRLRATPRLALAIELALLAPAVGLLLFVFASWGAYAWLEHRVQVAADQALAAALDGRDAAQQEILARAAVVQGLGAAAHLRLEFDDGLAVQVSYDASGAPIFALRGLAPLPPPVIVRRSAARLQP